MVSGSIAHGVLSLRSNNIAVVGIILITASYALILLPFSIAQYAPNGWASAYIIVMEVIGVVCGVLFVVWEYKFSPAQFLPWHYLKDRSIIGSCLLYGIMFMSSSLVSRFSPSQYIADNTQVLERLLR